MENQPLPLFLSFPPVLVLDHVNYLPVCALQMALNPLICAAFATATIVRILDDEGSDDDDDVEKEED